MAHASRLQVLSVFKRLHRSKDKVFSGDVGALSAARIKIREEFSKHKTESDPAKISELLKIAHDSEEILRTKVLQAEQVNPKLYRMRSDHLQAKCVDARESCGVNCTCGW